MNLCVFLPFIIVNLKVVSCFNRDGHNNKQILLLFVQRRQGSNEDLEENPAHKVDYINDAQNLSEEEPIKPGHTLIRPSKGMLQSAAKYPQDLYKLVYGNLQNLGIMYGNTQERLKYSGFRKSNDVLNALIKSFSKINRNPAVLVIKPKLEQQNLNVSENLSNQSMYFYRPVPKYTFVPFDYSDFSNYEPNFRRSKKKSKYRKRDRYYVGTSTEKESDNESKEYERNPGNPFTIHKNRYKVNYMWNHVMTGDHMNINPYGPQFHSLDPSGADLLFNRKWWYFNQDDYRPF